MQSYPPIPDQPAPYLALVEYARSTLGDGIADELHRIYVDAAARNRRAGALRAFARQLPAMRRRLAEYEARSEAARKASRPVYDRLKAKIAHREAALSDPARYIATPGDDDEADEG